MVLHKYIHLLIVCCIFGYSISEANVSQYSEIDNYVDYEHKALELAKDLIGKLKSNTRFTIEDERKFFGGTSNPYSFTSYFYRKFGYVRYETSNYIMREIILKPLPKYSFFGETLRLYRNLFFKEEVLPVLSVGKSYCTDSDNELRRFGSEYIYVYIQPEPDNSHIIRLCYSKKHGFFIEDVDINGKNIFLYLNLMQRKDDIHLNSQFLDMMHEYIK